MNSNNLTATRSTTTSDLSLAELAAQNQRFACTGGVSAENRTQGFRPAFFDTDDNRIHIARFADGRLAPMHVFDGLPGDLVVRRTHAGRVVAVKSSLVSGFVRENQFFTREQAAIYAATAQVEHA